LRLPPAYWAALLGLRLQEQVASPSDRILDRDSRDAARTYQIR